ncbi:MAG: hypothetical protein ACTSXO_02020 [Candidatus Heimdallarchaeota archaeon]
MNRIAKFLGWLFFFALQAAFDTFVIWGLVTYGQAGTFVSDKTTVILIAVPTIIVVNILLMIPAGLFSVGMFKREKERRGFPAEGKFSRWFKKEAKEEDFEKWFKEHITEEKIVKWLEEKANKGEFSD